MVVFRCHVGRREFFVFVGGKSSIAKPPFLLLLAGRSQWQGKNSTDQIIILILTPTSTSLLLFLIFFPKAIPPLPPTSHQPSYRTALLIALTCTFHALAVLLISTAVLYLSPQHLQPWANTLGIFATALAAVQFLPQLVTTWRLQAAGSLSVPTMFIQTPGSFVWAGSLAARLGPAGWSTWGIYLVTGCLQGGLLAMCIGFGVRDWRERERKKRGGEGEGEDQGEGNGRAMDGENTALLGNER